MFDLLSDDEDDDFHFGNEDFLENLLDTKKRNYNHGNQYKPKEKSPVKGFSKIKFNLAGFDSSTPVPSKTKCTVESPINQNINLKASTSIINSLDPCHSIPTSNLITPNSCNGNAIPSTSRRKTLDLVQEINTNDGKRVSPPSPKNKWSVKKRLTDCLNSPNKICLKQRSIPGPAGLLSNSFTTSPNENFTSPIFSKNMPKLRQNPSTPDTIFESESWQSMIAEFGSFQNLMSETNIEAVIDKYKTNNIQRGRVPSVLFVMLKEIQEKGLFSTHAILQDKTGLINSFIYGKQGNKVRENLDIGCALLLRGATIFNVNVNQKDVKDKRYYLSVSHRNIVCVYQGHDRISRFSKQELSTQMKIWMEELSADTRSTTRPNSYNPSYRNLKPPTCTRTLNIIASSSGNHSHSRNSSPTNYASLSTSKQASISSSKDICKTSVQSSDKTCESKEEESFMNDDFDKMFQNDDFDELMKDNAIDDIMATLNF